MIGVVDGGQGIEALQGRGDDQAIHEAAKQFEAIFLNEVFKSMRATVPESGEGNKYASKMFTDMLDGQYASLSASSGGYGLAEALAEQMGAKPIDPNAAAAAYAAQSGASGAGGPRSAPQAGYVTPVEGQVSSSYGPREMAGRDAHHHDGVDIAAPEGTPIRAAKAGRVSFAGEKGGYGNTVVLTHSDGSETLYAHASALLVEAGSVVRAGQTIAEVGSTGRSTGPHLHFELRKGGQPVDPAEALGQLAR